MKIYSRFFMILIILLYFYQVYIYQEVPLILGAQEGPGEFRAFLVGTDEYKQAERLKTLIDMDRIYLKLDSCAAKTKFLITDVAYTHCEQGNYGNALQEIDNRCRI